jgi:hypothetical protein
MQKKFFVSHFQFGANILKAYFLSLTIWLNKLECLTLMSFFGE